MLALLLALASPELDIRGISVSYGNTTVENAFRNAVAILRRAGKRATLAVGARRPLKRPLAVARDTHGESGLGYAELPPAGVILDFVKSLDRLLAEQPEPVTLVTLGPVTGLALALRSDPDLVRAKVARHIAMIGNVGAKGNTTRYAEFNAWCDPEALDVVLRAELPTEMVGLDVTREMVLAQHETTRLQHAGAPQARWINDALRFYIEFHKQQEGLDGCIVNDVLPIAALRASAGWPVTVFDASAQGLERAAAEVPRRTRALVALERATQGIVERGLLEFTQARSLLQAVQDADWVIEAIPEDAIAKQKLFGSIEQVTGPDSLPTSPSSGIPPAEIFARCRRQDRCLVAHPLNPPELIPLVEVVPAARTSAAAVVRTQEYLRALGRMPILLKQPIPGYVVGRITAAVWRECIALVLEGVIDVDQLDRAVSLGPALGWAAAGPHLTYHLAAGDGGVTLFLQQLLGSFEGWWGQLATWTRLEPEQQRALTQSIERAYKSNIEQLREARDRRLGAILRVLEQARTA